uniref:uncharacterized protein LOC122602650 n=1 Tax=Erigeron canadensis TaxID=72917 RepID=UPI001CB915B2|nr:uncharacterized protein LOC122602650 [Erigeron canadensis]
MPPEILPIDRKDVLKERKPSSSEPVVQIVPPRWRESPTTPSSHPNNVAGGPPDYRRPFSGTRVSVDVGSQNDRKGGNSWEATASPNGNFHSQSDFLNSWDQLAKNNSGGVSTTGGGPRLEKGNSLGSSIDWKPIKWSRSGSLTSRGSGFSHSSGCKIVGVDSLDTKVEAQPGNGTLHSPSGDATPCVTPRTPDEANSRKKARLGWGEGLAKYEKKKVDPDDVVDKEPGSSYGMVDGVSSSETSLPGPSSLPSVSPTVPGNSECASPTTSCSFACSSSPGLEEKTSLMATTVDDDNCNPGHVSQNNTQGLTFKLENLELTEGFNMSSLLDELLQTDTSAPGSGFAMDKLQLWKADITRTLETTECEIDSLENELKLLISSCPIRPASSSFLKACNRKNTEDLRIIATSDINMEKADSFFEEHTAVESLKRESPGMATSRFVEPNSIMDERIESSSKLDIRSQKAECSQDHVGDGMVASCGDGSQVSTVPFGREDELYKSILASNKSIAKSVSDEMSISPVRYVRGDIGRAVDKSLIAERIATRKRFLKFKERVTTLKFCAFHYAWKKDLRVLSVKKFGSKPQKKFDLSSRSGSADHHKHRTSIHGRLSSPAGSLSLVPTTELVKYVNKLLTDLPVRTCRKEQKMPSLILDRSERMSSRFISDNGLVDNPVDVEKEKSIVNPWTVEDKEIFLERYSQFGKNFRKIASFLPNKTVADCVEFYYKNHKSDYFQKAKRNSEFTKGKSNTTSTYLVTSGKQRLNRETRATTSLDMLGAASAMVANVNSGSIVERSNDLASFCNEQETAAADVLAGICGSISPEALGSCITSLADHGDVYHRVRRCQKVGGSSLNYVDEDTCSDDSCEEMDASHWTDEEKSSLIKAVRTYGKDFLMISRCVRTRSSDQCRVYFSKARKRLGLDVIDIEGGSEGTTGANQGGGGSDHDDTCMVDSGSGISQDKSSMECKMEVEDLHSSDRNVVSDVRESELVLGNSVMTDFEAENKPGGRISNADMEGAADSEGTEAANGEESPQNACSDSASGAKVEDVTVPSMSAKLFKDGIGESEHELPSRGGSRSNDDASAVRGSSCCPVEDLNSVSYHSRGSSLDLSIDHRNNLDLNAASENVSCQEAGNGFVMSNLFSKDLKRKTVGQDDVSSRLSFRKSGQRSSSIDGYHLNLPKRSLSNNEPQSNFKLDESHLMPRDGCIQMCTSLTSVSQEQRRSSSLGVEKPNRSGDVKLFGQILTNNSSESKANGTATLLEKPDANLKFVSHSTHRKLASLDLDHSSKDFAIGVENNLQLSRSYGFWDGNRIQTGFPSLPDSAVLLAKYPAAFSNISTMSKLDQPQQLHSSLESGNEQCNINGVPSFQTRKLSSNTRVPGYHPYGQPFNVDKLLPEIPRRKELEALSSGVQQGRGMSAVGGACNGVSDPVAAIRMHYAKTELYKNGGAGESWRGNVSDIGSR